MLGLKSPVGILKIHPTCTHAHLRTPAHTCTVHRTLAHTLMHTREEQQSAEAISGLKTNNLPCHPQSIIPEINKFFWLSFRQIIDCRCRWLEKNDTQKIEILKCQIIYKWILKKKGIGINDQGLNRKKWLFWFQQRVHIYFLNT